MTTFAGNEFVKFTQLRIKTAILSFFYYLVDLCLIPSMVEHYNIHHMEHHHHHHHHTEYATVVVGAPVGYQQGYPAPTGYQTPYAPPPGYAAPPAGYYQQV